MRPGAPRRPAAPSPAAAVAMAGAVDLAAVKARSEAAARAAEAPPPAAGSAVLDVTEASFQSEVLDRSFQVPVLIDMWAEWCQPCKQLSPVLEKLAAEGNGSWVLAKVDVDANPRIQQALQVQSIPTVFAVIGGQLLQGFQGALPEAQVREFLAAVLEAAKEAGLSGPLDAPQAEEETVPVEEPDDPRFTAAEQALDAGDFDAAIAHYQAIVDAEPGNSDAIMAVRQVRLMQRVDDLDPSIFARAQAAPEDVSLQLAAADLDLGSGDPAGALRRLLDLLPRVSGDERDAVRERLVEYFDLLGAEDERVGPARREMARALF